MGSAAQSRSSPRSLRERPQPCPSPIEGEGFSLVFARPFSSGAASRDPARPKPSSSDASSSRSRSSRSGRSPGASPPSSSSSSSDASSSKASWRSFSRTRSAAAAISPAHAAWGSPPSPASSLISPSLSRASSATVWRMQRAARPKLRTAASPSASPAPAASTARRPPPSRPNHLQADLGRLLQHRHVPLDPRAMARAKVGFSRRSGRNHEQMKNIRFVGGSSAGMDRPSRPP